MKLLALASFLLFTGFNVLSVRQGGLLSCYSEYYYHWQDKCKLSDNFNLWQAITMIAALLMFPPMIGAAEGNPLQCLGFLAPAYLIVVSAFPHYKDSKKEHTIHSIAAIISAICTLVWVIWVCSKAWVIIASAVLFLAVAFATSTLKASITFWLEMIVFAAAYVTLLLI